MKLEYKCKVESKTYLGNSILKTTFEDKDFTLIPDERGLLKEIIIRVKLINTDSVIPKFSPSDTPGIKFNLNLNTGNEVSREIRTLLQYLESDLSFYVNLKKIYWENPDLTVIPEEEEDKKIANVLSIELAEKEYHDPEIKLTMETFIEIVSNKKKYEFLTIVKSFFREGEREFKSFRYISAFYNYYFVIEDLYGKGKTKNSAIQEEFKKNQTFRGFINWMIDSGIKGRHKTNIEKFLLEENKSYDVNGLIELIVKVRGNLHHFSSKSTKRKGTPFSQQDFESMALLLGCLSKMCILQKIQERNISVI